MDLKPEITYVYKYIFSLFPLLLLVHTAVRGTRVQGRGRAFLLSDDAASLTGQQIVVCGGASL